MGVEWKFKEAFRKGIKFVKHYYPEYMLIGRLARNVYATPETTLDIDFLVNLDDHKTLAELIERASLEYQISPTDVGHFQYKIFIHGIRIDLVKPPLFKLDQEVVSHRRTIKIKGIGEVQIVSPEDLAVLYILSSLDRGERDLIKAKDVIEYSKGKNDFNEVYFLRECEKNNVKPICITLISRGNRQKVI